MNPSTASFLGGFTAAEGCFTRSRPRGTQQRFAFSVGLGASDSYMCELFLESFMVGHIVRAPRRKPHYDAEIAFRVQSLIELVEVIVPFMDEWLPSSHKRLQYQEWRGALLEYWRHGRRGS
jgi:LAGLIDADG endonuclease